MAEEENKETQKKITLEDRIKNVFNEAPQFVKKLFKWSLLGSTTLASVALVGAVNTLTWTGGHFVAAKLTKQKDSTKNMNLANTTVYPLNYLFKIVNQVPGILNTVAVGAVAALGAFLPLYQTAAHFINKYTPTKFVKSLVNPYKMVKGAYENLKENYIPAVKKNMFMLPIYGAQWALPKIFEQYSLGTAAQAQQLQIPSSGVLTIPFSILSKPQEKSNDLEEKINSYNKSDKPAQQYLQKAA